MRRIIHDCGLALRTLLAACAIVQCTAPCRAGPPRLFSEWEFTCVDIAEAVNHYVAVGEEETVRELTRIGTDGGFSRLAEEKAIHTAWRVGWVCRILFEPKEGTHLRPPRLGALFLPYRSMPLEKWPLYPIASSGQTYFVMGHGYVATGQPENIGAYLSYCRSAGVFRTKPIPVPTREEALRDANALRQSREWKAIAWKDEGEGFRYEFDEALVWETIELQATGVESRK